MDATPENLQLPGEEPEQTTARLFLNMRTTKRYYRRYTGKPVRKVRRFAKRKGKGKGKRRNKGKGKGSHYAFLADIMDGRHYEEFFKIRKGKGKGSRKGKQSSGMGLGRGQNPPDRHGDTMKCFGCGSTSHLADDPTCPNYGKGNTGKGKGRSVHFA